MFNFVWQVPDFRKDQGVEGDQTLTVRVEDFAGNYDTIQFDVFLDLTPPSITNIDINISNTIHIAGEAFTANPNVTICGTFFDDDVSAVWVVPGDYNETTQTFGDKKYGVIQEEDGDLGFCVEVVLYDPSAGGPIEPFMYNEMLISQINDMVIFVQDEAGHVSSKPLRVYRDVAPPMSPRFTLSAGSSGT
ncbi:TPA: hypothetical protein HA265_01815 [Candidatus Woesearchaeota archaeon]|nr:hypothetical protein [Candidatus Woesearchaeota archaeon]